MDAWIHFNEQVRNPVGISCALKANLSRCMYIFSTPISSGLLCSSTVDSQSFNNLMSLQFYVFYWHFSSLLYRFFFVCFFVCHVCLRVTMTDSDYPFGIFKLVLSTQGKISGYLPRPLIWIGYFSVYHRCKKVRFTYKYVHI